MLANLLTGLSLVLVFEGILPFLSPETFRKFMRSAIERPDSTLRYIGLSSMIAGVVILTLVN